MNTAMDDGRQESLGEQTLSFPPVRDDDDTFDAFAASGREDRAAEGTGAEEAVAEDRGASGEPSEESTAEERPEPEPVNFFAPRKPVTGTGRPARGTRAAAGDRSTPEPPAASGPASGSGSGSGKPAVPPSTGPSLFVKPASLGGPATTDEPVPEQEDLAAGDEDATALAAEETQSEQWSAEPAEPSENEQLSHERADGGRPGDAELPDDVADLSDDVADLSDDTVSSDEEPHTSDAFPSLEEPHAADEPHVSDESLAADESPAWGEPHDAEEPLAEEQSSSADSGDSADFADGPSEEQSSPVGELSDDGLEPESATEDPATEDEEPPVAEHEQQPGEETPGEGREEAPDEPQAADESAKEAEGQGPTRTEALPPELAETLMTALNGLRESIADLRFGIDLPGAEDARQAQADLLAQLEDYVLPRVKTSSAPALIVVAGSTGAGKSTLVNSLAERNVSRTGVRRPTTGTPVLVCHPEDRRWFAEGELLGTLRRLEKPSPAADLNGLVIVATEKLPQGVALLDTPDIDSVVEEHHDVAHRMLDAADLWIFVTTAARYADAPAWSLLRLAKERGARLAIVLSRVQPRSADVVLKHFVRMLTEYGLGEIDRFVIHEAKVNDGRLPDSEVTDLRLWLAELSVDEERRAHAVRETLNGVLNSFRTRVPALAKHLEAQVAFRAELRSDVEAAFLGALSAIDKASKNGSLLHGEVLARWQDYAGSGDLMRSLRLRRRGRAARQAPERVTAFKAAIRTGLESVIVAAANRAAEEVVARWRHRSELGAKLGEGLDRPSDNLVRHTSRAIASWQEHLGELVSTEGVAKRSVSKLVSFDPDSLSLIFMVAMFSGSNGEGVPHRLVNALLGAESLRGIGAKALSDLRARIGMLFDEEAMRYVQALDSVGIPDESVATRLYQATYNLEVAR